MQRKKKICKRCEKEKYIYSDGLCSTCDKITNPAKYLIKPKAEKKGKEKKETISQIEKRLDKVFSEWVRLSNADGIGMVECFTSGKVYHWTKLHAGHYISRRHKSTRWHELNVQPQSVAENMFNQGNAPQFAVNLDKKFGVGTSTMLLELSKESKKFTRDDLYTMIEKYTDLVKKLKNEIQS